MTRLLFTSKHKQLELKEELIFDSWERAIDYLNDNKYTKVEGQKMAYYKKLPIWEIFVEVKQEL